MAGLPSARRIPSGVAPRKNMRDGLFSGELWLSGRIGDGKSGPIRLSRIRLWLIFMLLRDGALRPAEILALAPADLAPGEGVVRVGGKFEEKQGNRTGVIRLALRAHKSFHGAGFPQQRSCYGI